MSRFSTHEPRLAMPEPREGACARCADFHFYWLSLVLCDIYAPPRWSCMPMLTLPRCRSSYPRVSMAAVGAPSPRLEPRISPYRGHDDYFRDALHDLITGSLESSVAELKRRKPFPASSPTLRRSSISRVHFYSDACT